MASGYFAIWLAVGAAVYALGAILAAAAMHWESMSRAVPLLARASLLTAGAFQFTHWKMITLLRCRSPAGCADREQQGSFLLGCRQGVACCLCSAAPMTIQIVMGMMNPFVMLAIALIIAGEKLLPRPDIIARFVGLAAILAGVANLQCWNL